jgi:hypothetical protein
MRLHVRPRKLRVDDIHIVLAPQIFRPQIFGVDKHIHFFPFLIKQITNESVLLMKRAHRLFSFKTRQFFVTEYMPQKLVEINRLLLLRTNGIRKRSFPTPAKFFSFSRPFFHYDPLIFQSFSYVHPIPYSQGNISLARQKIRYETPCLRRRAALFPILVVSMISSQNGMRARSRSNIFRTAASVTSLPKND